MSRNQVLFASVVVIMALFPRLANAQEPQAIKPGEPYSGEIKGEPMDTETVQMAAKATGYAVLVYFPEFYLDQIPISLNAGQKIEIQASMAGDNRKVSIVLIDPSGRAISKPSPPVAKTAALKVNEVAATGIYRIFVFTDKIGVYTLKSRASGIEPAIAEGESMAELEARIARLKKELAEAEKKLNSMKLKQSGKKKS